MHELSIAQCIIGTVTAAAAEAGDPRVREVRLRVGALAGVSKQALHFCYSAATQGTKLEGSLLSVQEVPVVIFCAVCGGARELPGVQSFRCPVCGTASGDIRQGREMEIESVVVDEANGHASS